MSITHLFLFFLLFWAPSLYAQESFEILSYHDQYIDVKFTLPSFKRVAFTDEKGLNYERIQLEEKWGTTDQRGFPQLPFTATLFQVPPTGELRLEVLEQVEGALTIPFLYPISHLSSLPEKEADKDLVQDDNLYSSFYPVQTLVLDERATLRGVSVVRVKLYPFQWQAKTGNLRYIKILHFRLHFAQPFSSYVSLPSHYEKMLRSIVTGYRDFSRDRELDPVMTPPQQESLQFKIDKTGLYSLDAQQLQSFGLSESCLSQGQLVLSSHSQQIVPQWMSQSVHGFGHDDRLEFYVPPYQNDPFTQYSVYQLTCWNWSHSLLSSPKSSHMIRRGLFEDGRITEDTRVIEQFRETTHFEENKIVWLETPHAPPKDYWFWKKLASPYGQTLAVYTPSLVAGEVSLRIALQGQSLARTSARHRIDLYANEEFLGEMSWSFSEDTVKEFSVPQGLFVEGENHLRFDFPKEEQINGNILYLNWIEVTYPRRLVAIQNELTFSVTGTGKVHVHVSGFNQSGVRVFDVTYPNHVAEVIHVTHESDQIIFETVLDENKIYYATTVLQPIEQAELLPPTVQLKNTHHQVDYILITTEALFPAVQPLLTHREHQGLRTLAVSVEAIYREFSSGFPTPYAIKEFLRYAYQYWQPPAPSYVLFFGESSVDYKDYLHRRTSQIPPYLTETLFGVTPDDNWFVSVEGDDPLPDMMVGRLPGKNEQEVKTVVDKIIGYETHSPASSQILLISDDEKEFEQVNDRMEASYLSQMQVNKVYMSQYHKDIEQAKTDIIKYFNEGALLTQYIGHGHITIWAQEKLLNKAQIALLDDSDQVTLVLALNCLNAYFASPTESSLGEELLLVPRKGAFAVFSSAGLSYAWQYEAIDEAFFSAFFQAGETRLGQLVTQAKLATYGKGATEEALSIFTLLGDPATQLHAPSR